MWDKLKSIVAMFPVTLATGGGAALLGGLIGIQMGGPVIGILSALVMGVAGAAAGFYKEHYKAATTISPSDALKPRATSYGVSSVVDPTAAKDATQQHTFVLTPDDQMLQSSQNFLKQKLIDIKNDPAASTAQKVTAAITLAPIATAIPKVGKQVHARITGTVQMVGDSAKLHIQQVTLETENALLEKMTEGQQHNISDKNITVPLIKTETGYQIPLDHPDTLIAVDKVVAEIEHRNVSAANMGAESVKQVTAIRKMVVPVTTAHLLQSSAEQYGLEGTKKILDHHYAEYLEKESGDKARDARRVEIHKQAIQEKYKDGSLAGKPEEEVAQEIYVAVTRAEEASPHKQKLPEPIPTDDGSVLITVDDSQHLIAYSAQLAPMHQALANGVKKHTEKAAETGAQQQQLEKAMAVFQAEKDTPLDSSGVVLPAAAKKVEAGRGQ